MHIYLLVGIIKYKEKVEVCVNEVWHSGNFSIRFFLKQYVSLFASVGAIVVHIVNFR